MKKFSIAAALLAAAFATAVCAAPKSASKAPKDAVIATVNGANVMRSELDAVVAVVSQGKPVNDDMRMRVLQQICAEKAIQQRARKDGIYNQRDVKFELSRAEQQIITNVMAGKYLQANPVLDVELQKIYDAQKKAYGQYEYEVRHILVKDEAKAKELIAKIKGGADFAKLAEENTEDKNNAKAGGLLPWNSPAIYNPEFAKAFTTLQPGQMRQTPLKSPFGWHVIKLEGRRDAKNFPTFEQAKPRLQQQASQAAARRYLSSIVAAAKVQFKEGAPVPASIKEAAAKAAAARAAQKAPAVKPAAVGESKVFKPAAK